MTVNCSNSFIQNDINYKEAKVSDVELFYSDSSMEKTLYF